MTPSDSELIQEWLEWFEFNQGRSAGSVNKYHRYLTDLSAWLLEIHQVGLTGATTKQLEEYSGVHAHKQGMAARSRRPLVAAIRGFYRWCSDQWYMQTNPAESLPYPTAGTRLPTPMQLHHAEALMTAPDLDTFVGVRDAAIIALFIGCGPRLGGVARMNQSDLIFTEVDGQEWMLVRLIEKRDKERIIPAPHEARLLMRAYLGHPDLREIDRTLADGDQVLFVSTMNRTIPQHEYYGEQRRLSERSISDLIERYGDQAGIPRDQCHPHALRHLYGTELTESDVQQHKIQVLLGHSDAKSTSIYQHVAMGSLINAMRSTNPLAKMKTPVTDLIKHLTS